MSFFLQPDVIAMKSPFPQIGEISLRLKSNGLGTEDGGCGAYGVAEFPGDAKRRGVEQVIAIM